MFLTVIFTFCKVYYVRRKKAIREAMTFLVIYFLLLFSSCLLISISTNISICAVIAIGS
ncbi:hypothetical protein DES34_107262 [Brevibacillus brevis]|nr:hypothetical protein DES34_107262 [Brevibacillus brevis]TQK61968.1 hypothetical protein FB479_10651 [Brevibacillus sp. AG162]VEF91494.1 Uncharacterised protein [Brevibacillus brevis]